MNANNYASGYRLREFVSARAKELAARATGRDGTALAQLAALRRSVGSPAGADPQLWALTVSGLEAVDAPDHVTRSEQAAHLALGLFAVHQQSQKEPMHVPGVGLGTAVRRLSAARDSDVSLRRRFTVAVSATDSTELAVHLRSLVQQLRVEQIGLDYGLLAQQLADFDVPERRSRVRQRWGREFARDGRPNDPDPNGDEAYDEGDSISTQRKGSE